MALLQRIFGSRGTDGRARLRPLYDQAVAAARRPHWYVDGGVADTVTGRFDMLAAVLALVIAAIEREPGGAAESVALTEIFIDDMDGSMREMGFGDLGVGKQVGKLVAALGGRLGAFRDLAALDDAALDALVVRNIFAGVDPGAAQRGHVREGLRTLAAALAATDRDRLLAGKGDW